MDARHFGRRLKELRTAAELSQAELANKAGLSTQAIADLEHDRRRPTWETVIALAQALARTPNDFAGDPARPGRSSAPAAARRGRNKK